ncbi:Com family DNA-binding transcriptional regulator [Ignatzschineria indica]|nr:Com family DNA-binding transcriptional regulator [Ignatzschineria indica]
MSHQKLEIRCVKCNRKLCEAVFTKLEIKCPRCKAFNILSK